MLWITDLWRNIMDILTPFRSSPDEEVIVHEHKSLLVLLASFRKLILVALLLVIVVIWSPRVQLPLFGKPIPMYQLISPLILLGSLLLLLQQIFIIAQWFFRIYVVTTRRVFIREGIWARKVTEARLHRAQTVSRTTRGILRGLFDIGDVQIETAGTTGTLLFVDVDHPGVVETKVTEAIKQHRTEMVQLEQQQIRSLLRETLSL